MTTRDEIIDSLAEKCEYELDYYDVVNESAEEVEYRLIVEFVLDTLLDVWKGGNNAN